MTLLLVLHIAISLIGIFTGFLIIGQMLANQLHRGWTAIFLATTIITNVSGFPLPAKMFLPSHAVGIISLVALAVACFALYVKQLSGTWRAIYVVAALASQFFNVFVLVAQMFNKIPALRDLAPTQSEPPFGIAQGVVLIGFVVLGRLALQKLRPQ